MSALKSIQISPRAENRKTGPMPTTSRPLATCPSGCPFRPDMGGGCYGTGARGFGIADKFARDLTEDQALKILQGARRDAKLLRDRVVGDVVTPDGKFDLAYVKAIARVARRAGLTPFGYTHATHLMTPRVARAVEKSGYVLNSSCETEQDITNAVALGLPTTVTGDSWAEGEMVAGRRIVTCPAQTHEGVTCSSCGLCAKPDRACTVRFMVHGVAHKKAAASIRRRIEEAA